MITPLEMVDLATSRINLMIYLIDITIIDKICADDQVGKKFKGALVWYGKLTWESAHAWNLIILCLLIVWGMTFIFMVHLSFYAIPLLIYDVMYDINTIP